MRTTLLPELSEESMRLSKVQDIRTNRGVPIRWQPRSLRFDREVTVPNPEGISITPSKIDGLSSSHVRVLTLYEG
ncbi:hypothetical protein Taro_008195 [Colocasia esculenta]|uniref:Uncharacterized protein n=1 Tax=Colocasia esculenta TaxID=4460 RepID=A0A843U2R3_COLES|nr:hypothetical protein [Colocasia esculenta]